MVTALAPPPRQSLSEWADENRIISPERAVAPGRWRTTQTEYLREIMDAMTDPRVHTIAVMKPAQVGWTEVLLNASGYFIDRDPASILVIQPTVKMAEDWSKTRFAPMVRDTVPLRGKIRDPKSRDSENTILQKGYPGGNIAIVGANTPNDLASRPIRVVLADEVDKYPPSAGEFGDPLSLALSRQRTFWNRKTLIGSTPGRADTSTVLKWFRQGDQRRYHVPCPHCGHEQVIVWENIVWDKDETGHLPETARYLCRDGCGTLWSDAERVLAVEKGRWIATAPFHGVASFAIGIGLSPWVSLEQTVRGFLLAKDYAPTLIQWFNETKGEPWEERGEASDAGALAERVEAYDGETLPEGVRLVTAGVDTQDDRLEVTVTGWGAESEAWVIRHDVILGDPGMPGVWNDLDGFLRDGRYRTLDGRLMRVEAACVDSGGHHGAAVLAFCRAREMRRIYATKGVPNDNRGSKPIWGKALLGTKNSGDRLWAVGVDTGKDGLQARLRIVPGDGPTPNAVHFPDTGLSADYFDQLTSEMAVTEIDKAGRKKRKWVMKPGQRRNEALDCFILSWAALESLPTSRLLTARSYSRVPVIEENDEPGEPAQEAAATEYVALRKKGRRTRWAAYG